MEHTFAPLKQVIFNKRYKRFLADVVDPQTGKTLTAHCANSGSMRSCLEEGAPAWVSVSDDPARKLPFTLELLSINGEMVCVNTQVANKVMCSLLETIVKQPGKCSKDIQGISLLVEDLKGFEDVTAERVFEAGTRFDFLATSQKENFPALWIEVKSVSLRINDAEIGFPDAVTERGTKHLEKLAESIKKGQRGLLIFAIMRSKASMPAETLAQSFRTAHEIDPTYARTLKQVIQQGVMVRVVTTSIGPGGIHVTGYFPYPFNSDNDRV